MPGSVDSVDPTTRSTRLARAALIVLLAAIAGVWATASTGFVSSNDGSHVALARALGRGELRIDSDVDLTLGIDLARTDAGFFSDRPPGTAAWAVPALRLGAALDGPLAERSRARGAFVLPPAAPPYRTTHERRFARATPLVDRIGTATAASVHAIAVGLVGLAALFTWLRRRGIAHSGALFACATLGLGSSYGTYATTLFSHVSAATWTLLCVLACESAARGDALPIPRRRLAALGGFAGAMAIACDYLLILAIVPLVLVTSRLAADREGALRVLGAVGVGALPVALAVAAYHHAAFGSPWSIGYDHHVTFAFARSRGDTFSGDPVAGAWQLLGAGSGGGLLALSPLVLLGGILGALDPRSRWVTLAWLPWVAALTLHVTPGGGAGADHRYLVPALPFFAAGLAGAWTRVGALPRLVFGAALAAGAFTTWSHFLSWHDTELNSAPALGAIVAGLTAVVVAGVTRRRAPRNPSPESGDPATSPG